MATQIMNPSLPIRRNSRFLWPLCRNSKCWPISIQPSTVVRPQASSVRLPKAELITGTAKLSPSCDLQEFRRVPSFPACASLMKTGSLAVPWVARSLKINWAFLPTTNVLSRIAEPLFNRRLRQLSLDISAIIWHSYERIIVSVTHTISVYGWTVIVIPMTTVTMRWADSTKPVRRVIVMVKIPPDN